MAKRKSSRKAKKSPRKAAARKRPAKRASKRSGKRSASRRPARGRAAASRPTAQKVRHGLITHTELASMDPPATRAWAVEVLGWQFGDAVPTPTGLYHMWRFETGTGGGIRVANAPETPGSIPYCEVRDIQSTYAKAIQAGAGELMAPSPLPGGMGWIAIVAAPGGVPIGFWAP